MRDSGDYVCRVSTSITSHSKTINVFVGYRPEFETVDEEDVDMVEGLPVSLNCATNGNPEGQVSTYTL